MARRRVGRRRGQHVFQHLHSGFIEIRTLPLSPDIPESGKMIGQIADRNRFIERCGKIFQIFRERCLEIDQSAGVADQQCGNGGSRLGRAGDIQNGIGSHGVFPFGGSISRFAFAVNGPVLARQHHAAENDLVIDIRLQDRLDRLHDRFLISVRLRRNVPCRLCLSSSVCKCRGSRGIRPNRPCRPLRRCGFSIRG